LIVKDAAMTVKILRVANSAGYHRRTPLASIEQSLMVIGIDMVKTLLISESVFQLFDNIYPTGGDDLRGFWRHSLTAAVTARLIAEKMGDARVEEAYLAGLLHDVGRLALLAILPKEYGRSFFAPDDDSLCALEQRTLQMTHAEVGAWMIEQWKLDSFLADSVLYHHDLVARLENSPPLVRIVCLAHHLLVADPGPELEAAAALCGLTVADLDVISNLAAERTIVEAKYLGIDLGGADLIHLSAPAAAAPIVDSAKDCLGVQVRNLILTTELGRTWSRQGVDGGLTEAITWSAQMLFDFNEAMMFRVDAAGQVLNGTSTGQQRQRWSELFVALADNGLIAQAALQRRVTMIDCNENSTSLLEEQLRRILGAECLVCVPLVNKDRCTGVLVGGTKPWQLGDLQKRESFLLAFGKHAAGALNAEVNEPPAGGGDLSNLAEQYQQASRRVAHEVNNPLSIIKNYLNVLDRKLARKEPVGNELSILNEEIDRVGQLINAFAELQPAPAARAIEINTVVKNVVRLFAGTVPPSVNIVVKAQNEACSFDGDAGTLKQILVNLIKNAVEALPVGGEIEISNNGVIDREGHQYVELSIRDNGAGIPAAMMVNLFSPVRSTKGEEHCGLGLSIVHGLITQMRGVIHCRTGKKGTTFDLLLPVSRAAGQASTTSAQVRASA